MELLPADFADADVHDLDTVFGDRLLPEADPLSNPTRKCGVAHTGVWDTYTGVWGTYTGVWGTYAGVWNIRVCDDAYRIRTIVA